MGMVSIKADKHKFAVFQTIYANADYNMWYDWERRLDDTKWTEECFFVMKDGVKIGGYIALDDRICFPFLISPFQDRGAFWTYLISSCPKRQITGVSHEDAAFLSGKGYRVVSRNQVMCRPTDSIAAVLPAHFTCSSLSITEDETYLQSLGQLIVEGYQGSICNEIFGEPTRESALEDMMQVLKTYSKCNLSRVITDRQGTPAAVCLAGSGEHYLHGYVEIADLCVLPKYRGMGLATYLIANTLSSASDKAPYVKLLVHKGNPAEAIYFRMGFVAGPEFTNLEALPPEAAIDCTTAPEKCFG